MCDGQAEMFKVFGVGARIRIIELLKERGPLGAKELAGLLGMTLPAVSQHLKVLRQAGLVRNKRMGYFIPYEVDPVALDQCRQVISKVCTCGCTDSCRVQDSSAVPSARAADELERLKKYEHDLQEELEKIRARIGEVEKG
ncbi:MAG: metalloregulator ArsR/SmtB family transcription factor [Thermodesulfobacteriota bacterium]